MNIVITNHGSNRLKERLNLRPGERFQYLADLFKKGIDVIERKNSLVYYYIMYNKRKHIFCENKNGKNCIMFLTVYWNRGL